MRCSGCATCSAIRCWRAAPGGLAPDAARAGTAAAAQRRARCAGFGLSLAGLRAPRHAPDLRDRRRRRANRADRAAAAETRAGERRRASTCASSPMARTCASAWRQARSTSPSRRWRRRCRPGALNEPLVEDRLALVMREGHPGRARAWTLADYAGAAHVTIAIRGDEESEIDAALARRGPPAASCCARPISWPRWPPSARATR